MILPKYHIAEPTPRRGRAFDLSFLSYLSEIVSVVDSCVYTNFTSATLCTIAAEYELVIYYAGVMCI